MTIENMKRVLDAFYLGKRVRDMLPPLPEGVTASYIRYLDALETLQEKHERVKISDLGERLNLQRPGVTRTVKEMEKKGYLEKQTSMEDARVTYLAITPAGKALSEQFNEKVFESLLESLSDISDEDAETLIRTTEKIYDVLCAGRLELE